MALFCALPMVSVCAQENQPTLNEMKNAVATAEKRYTSNSIQSIDTADAALADVQPLQKQLQNWYSRTEHACYDRFFVTSCLDDAKLTHRKLSMPLQRISVEAKAYQRKEHIQYLDEELEKKNADKALKEENGKSTRENTP